MTVEEALRNLGTVLERRPYPYASSWPLELIVLSTPEDDRSEVLVKRFDGEVLRPAGFADAEREPRAYRLLADEGLGIPRCHAAGPDWLVLERVAGLELWQRGDLEAWLAAARWAGRLHRRFAARPPVKGLLARDEVWLRATVARARSATGDALSPIAGEIELAVERLSGLPVTLLHGELYASNVLVAPGRVAVVDWELSGLGPGVLDLAALVTGWEGEERERLIEAYGAVDQRDIAAAALVLALQWLGWAPGWEPPAAHRRDWLGDAYAAAGELR